MYKNRNKEILLELELVKEESIVRYADKVRDRDDVGVLRDEESGIIFLDRSDHMTIDHYVEIEDGKYWNADSRVEALKKYAEDDTRRYKQFKHLIENKKILDVGCGTGGFMDLARPVATSVSLVEPQAFIVKELRDLGYEVFDLTEQLPDQSYDVVTLFHTLEHLVEPIEVLCEIKRSLNKNGQLIIEVPHARDVLLKIPEFREFTFWSEHLILHTKDSLKKILETAGFTNVNIFGYQRYPLSNHLHWLVNNKPGGQKIYPEFDQNNKTYESMLIEADKTDTIIAIAEV